MVSLPGWNSIETTTFLRNVFELGGIALFFVVVVFELLAYFYGHRRDFLVDEAASIAATQQIQEETATQQRHDAEVAKLQSQLEQTRKQVAEDHSIKNRIRAVLAAVDPQILREIDAGNLTLRADPGSWDSA
jgi:hypothetical protein